MLRPHLQFLLACPRLSAPGKTLRRSGIAPPIFEATNKRETCTWYTIYTGNVIQPLITAAPPPNTLKRDITTTTEGTEKSIYTPYRRSRPILIFTTAGMEAQALYRSA